VNEKEIASCFQAWRLNDRARLYDIKHSIFADIDLPIRLPSGDKCRTHRHDIVRGCGEKRALGRSFELGSTLAEHGNAVKKSSRLQVT
jgi:hypothetical protein